MLTWRRNHLLRLSLILACALLASVTSASAAVSVTVSPTSVSVAPGSKQQQFTAQVTGSTNTAVTWSVSGLGCRGSSCGVITTTGLYSAPSSTPIPNIVTVTATSQADPTKSASAQVTLLTAIQVSISPTSKQLVTGAQQQFTATVTGSNAFAVNWSISGDGCAGSACGTIDGTGLYTAPAAVPNPATVTVTATSQADVSKSASAIVTILSPIAVSVSPSSAKVVTGAKQVFTAKVTGTANTAVTWSVSGAGCSGAACGTITTAGAYTAPASVPNPATVTVTATSQADASKSASANVTIILAVAVSVSPSSANVTVGAQQQFKATVTGTANQAVTWTISSAGCSGAACGTITSVGLYTAPTTIPSPATVMVTATSKANTTKSATATVTVVSGVAVSVTPTSAKLVIGAQQQFKATVTGTANTAVSWTISGAGCSGSTCGTITSAGLYTAPGAVPTPATVTATATSQADSSKSASATITVLPPVVVSVTPSSAKVVTGAKQQFTAAVTGTANTAVTWSLSGCSGSGCGTITSAGLYTAPIAVPTPPTVTVTATSQEDASKSASATVTVLPPVAVSVSPASAKVVTGGKQQFTASVTGTTNTAVKWSVSGAGCSALTCGAISAAGLYTAPSAVPNPPTVIVTATSQADPAKSATATVTVEVRGLINVLPSSALVTAGGQLQFSAQDGAASTLSVSSALAVTWKLTGAGCVGSKCGVITSTGLFTAPAVPPAPATIQVIAVSGAKSGSATVTIVPSDQSKLLGQYVFLFRGFDSSGIYQAAGSFTADGNGTILNGVEDINRLSGPTTNLPFTGSYTVSADNRGTITITTASGSSTFTFALNASGDRARFIEFDNTGIRGSGVIKAQTLSSFSDSSFNGSYALSVSGADFAGDRIAGLSAIFADGSGTIAGSTLDVNDGGDTLPPVNNFPGAYTVAANGRGTASLSVPILGGATFHFSIYVVSPREAFWLSTDPVGASSPMFSGEALQQSSSPFSESSFQGFTVFTQSGLANGSADVAVGQLSFDGKGAIAGQFDENNGGVITRAALLAGSYTTQPNGRTLLNLANVKTQSVTSFVAYLIAPNSAFLLSMEPAVKIGALQPQLVAPPFNNSLAAGTFTFAPDAVASLSAPLSTGIATLSGTGGEAGLAGTEDSSQTSGLSPNLKVIGTYSVSSVSNNGRGVANLTSPGPQTIAFWMVSFSEFVGVDIDAGYGEPTEVIFEQ